ncbi:MAG: hypothetical protein LBL84_03755 [Candidatus Nomurabacteria bacterium]|nr:hypothetical protein [Candidatus Nomurabacteria bacterium]
MANILGLKELFRAVRGNYSIDVPTQVGHITIMSIAPVTGIGIPSKNELDRLTRVVRIPELDGLKLQ